MKRCPVDAKKSGTLKSWDKDPLSLRFQGSNPQYAQYRFSRNKNTKIEKNEFKR
jgi:hypothetical protein